MIGSTLPSGTGRSDVSACSAVEAGVSAKALPPPVRPGVSGKITCSGESLRLMPGG